MTFVFSFLDFPYHTLNIVFFFFFLEKHTLNIVREMLTDVIRVLVNNLFKESFYGEKKKNN